MTTPYQAPNDEYLIIPNPIYDVVFRYIMEDPDSATIILETLLGVSITDLRFEPQQFTKRVETTIKGEYLTLCHVDFSATIELPNNEKEVVIIEVQKASLQTDIVRFRRYLSHHLQRTYTTKRAILHTDKQEEIEIACRIVPIFILNFSIEHEIDDLVIHSKMENYGVFTKLRLKQKYDFFQKLGYDMLVVQLPNIQKVNEHEQCGNEYTKKLYQLLLLFSQENYHDNNKHRLRILKKLFPAFLSRVIERLKSAQGSNPQLEDDMLMEDLYLNELQRKTNHVALLEESLNEKMETIKEKDKVLEQKDRDLELKDKALEQKDKILEEHEKTLKAKDKALDESKKVIEDLKRKLAENK